MYNRSSKNRSVIHCTLGPIFERPEASILGGNFSRFDGKRLGTGNGEMIVFSHATRKALRRRECRDLAVREGALGSEARVTWCVQDKREDKVWMFDNRAEKQGVNGALGRANLATNLLDTKEPDGQAHAWGGCLTVVEAVTAVVPVSGSALKKTVPEREVVRQELLDIT